ncbi:MAG: hypothetical protein LUE29_08175 [Lachnospiraceae bacterium]|nr:hypothetical protein [Lachnospiraceae bacterium]
MMKKNEHLEALIRAFADRKLDLENSIDVQEMASRTVTADRLGYASRDTREDILEELSHFQYWAERAGFYAGYAAALELTGARN